MRITLLVFALYLFSCHSGTVIHPQHKNIVETVYASGKIMADSEYTLYALGSGKVIQKLSKEGDTVFKGQLMYVINCSAPLAKLSAAKIAFNEAEAKLSEHSRILNDLKIAIDNAETRFANDSLNYVRRNRMWQQGIGMQNDVDNAQASYITSMNLKKSAEEKYYSAINDLNVSRANAKSQLASAENDLSNYLIRSENNGRVYQTFKELGETVKLNDPLALLGKTSNRIIRLDVDQQDIDKIKQGQRVLLKTDITGNKIYHATIIRIYPMMNETDQTFRADASFDDILKQVYTHSSVEANIIIRQKNNVLTIPKLAMVSEDEVIVRNNGRNKTIAVQTGIQTLDEVEIISGLTEISDVFIPPQK